MLPTWDAIIKKHTVETNGREEISPSVCCFKCSCHVETTSLTTLLVCPSSLKERGEFRNLVEDVLNEYHEFFKTYMRLQSGTFNKLLAIVEEDLKKEDSPFRKALSPAERLALTLQFLGHGDSMKILASHVLPGTQYSL